jgi:2-aminoethylphosphonate-pyruvate transaminase
VKQVLLNPGPVTLSERVRAALTRGDWCHREPEFAALMQSINARLARVYEETADAYEAATLTGSGTSAVEGMLQSFAPRDARTLVVSNGVYGERMANMLRMQGKPYVCTEGEWLEAIDMTTVNTLLAQYPDVQAVAVVHHETTTGRLNDLTELGELCKARGLDLLLDAVSSFAAEDIEFDAWNIGAVAATANKCLHSVPGLSFVLARQELWQRSSQAGSVYLDMHSYHKAQHANGFSPFTQSVQPAFALDVALDELAQSGGWEQRGATYGARAERIAATLDGLGIQTLLPRDQYSSILWTWLLPEGLNYPELHDKLKAEGFVIYAGQGNLAASVFRIAHMGEIDDDIERLCALLERSF